MATGSLHVQAQNESKNPVLAPSGLPHNVLPFDKITASDLEAAVKEGIEYQNQAIDAIVNQRSIPTFENTVVALDRSGWELNRAILALSNLEGACGDEDYQKAMQNVTPLLSEHSANILLNEKLLRESSRSMTIAKKTQASLPKTLDSSPRLMTLLPTTAPT